MKLNNDYKEGQTALIEDKANKVNDQNDQNEQIKIRNK